MTGSLKPEVVLRDAKLVPAALIYLGWEVAVTWLCEG